MERSELKKIVYEDEGKTKVLKGFILNETDFTLEIRAERTSDKITIGKRAIIKVVGVGSSE